VFAPGSRTIGLDGLLAALLGLIAGGVYAATFQARQFGDSSLLYQEFARHGGQGGFWYHALDFPAASALARCLSWLSPSQVLRALSVLSGALGVGFTFALLRAFGISHAAACIGAGLLAFSPAYWFFSTQVEVHALHGACVAGCALVVLLAPWRRPLAAAALSACVLPLLVLSHQSGALLGAGFLALTQHARRLHGCEPFGRPALLLGLGPLYLLGVCAGFPFSAWLGGIATSSLVSGSGEMLSGFSVEWSFANLWEGWIGAWGLLFPAALAGAFCATLPGWARATPLFFVLPSAAFFVLWGLPERGGYTLGSSMFVAVLAAAGLARLGRHALEVGLVLLALQAAWGHAALRAFDAPPWRARLEQRRAAIVHAIGERGGVVSLNLQFQYIEAVLPEVIELSLVEQLTVAVGKGGTIESFLGAASRRLEPLLARQDLPLLYDRGHLEVLQRVAPHTRAYSDALEAWLARRRRLEPVEGSDWPLVRLLPLEQPAGR
jgi:hypothetical protein